MGMFGCVLAHTGHFALFTYIRPFLESTAGVGTDGLALLLLGFGLANFGGTLLAGWLMQRSLRVTLALMPGLVGIAALALVSLPASVAGLALLVALWGMAFGGVPVAWSNWVARAVPDQAESAGGMVVASVQSSIAAGAAAGGALFSFSGIAGVFIAGGILMLLAAALIALKVKVDVARPGSSSGPAVHL